MKYNIIDALEEIKLKENCSLTELARRLGLNHRQLRIYLNGGLPRLSSAVKIANFYSCTLDYLFSFSNEYIKTLSPITLKPEKFYEKYDNILKANKISHFSLSKKIEICETSLSNWKKGCLPETYAILEIANYFGVSIDYLVIE